ncbi:hypothetical protein [Rhizobium sp. NXC24]|uniref:hypothetical protein n=1 Tax=Rhizobium sp. NXC24 TaxID=2048897 RepID=UPI000CDF3BDE|nr:hypothetical protein [Rhizobium sp. NXC24]AVA21970.1 hypothetical protein NXC24_CH02333 [Rhizobium sp. NXC24]
MDEFQQKQADYHKQLDGIWRAAIRRAFGDDIPRSRSWSDPYELADILRHFMEANYSYLTPNGHLPLTGVQVHEDGRRLLFDLSETGQLEMLPGRGTFEYIEKSPIESFFLLDLKRMSPSGVYEEVGHNEEILRVDGEDYDYAIAEHGVWEFDEDGNEVPVPDHAKTVLRQLSGKFLIVSKGSMWNQSDKTWAGVHATMSAAEIRADIERALAEE